MDIYENRRLRLRQAIEKRFKGNVKRCAEHMGMKPPQLHRWLSTTSKDRRRIEWDSARNIEERLGLSERWLDDSEPLDEECIQALLEGTASAPRTLTAITTWEHPDELPDGEFVQVPRLNVHPSAGHGNGETIEVDLERGQPQAFRAEWVRRERLRPGKLASMYADGHSMEPRIHDGDSLLVDTSQTTVIDGRVYVIWYASELRVKRLYKRVDGGIIIHSDNERDFPRLEVPAGDMEHVRIIGRVVHVQGTGGL